MKTGKKVAIVLGVFLLAGSMLVVNVLGRTGSRAQDGKKDLGQLVASLQNPSAMKSSNGLEGDLFAGSQRQNILLLGVDTKSEAESGRTDSMILFSIDQKSQKIRMVSLQRDLYLRIPGHGENRLNAAYAFGGTKLLVKTLRQNLDVEVDHYVKVDFHSFRKVIGALQGVDIALSSEEAAYLNREFGKGRFQAGTNHLGGAEALSYCRIRKLDSDFGRGERQRKMLKAIVGKMQTASLLQIREVLQISLQHVTTDMSALQVLKTATQVPKIASYEICEMSIPRQGLYQDAVIRQMMVLVPDLKKNKEALRDFLK